MSLTRSALQDLRKEVQALLLSGNRHVYDLTAFLVYRQLPRQTMAEPTRDDISLFTSLTQLSTAEAIKWLKVALPNCIDVLYRANPVPVGPQQ